MNEPDLRYIERRPNGKFRVRRRVDGQYVTLGTFDAVEAAIAARDAAGWLDEAAPDDPGADEETERDYREAAALFLDRKQAERVDWREFARLAVQVQDLDERLDDTQRIATIRIPTDRPWGATFTSDWHLGDGATDHRQWMRDIEFMIQTPRLGMFDLGDDRQNMRTFKTLSAVLGQALSPRHQAMMLRGVIDELTEKGKLLAKVDGNHDVEFDERIFGEALQRYLLERMKAPRFRNRGLVKLYVGDELYSIVLFHKSRFRSFLRKAHGAYREHQLFFPADVVAGGHDHEIGFEILEHYNIAREAGFPFGGISFLIKCGPYQDGDFGWKYFHNGGRPMNHTVVFWPDQHKMLWFPTPQDAAGYLQGGEPVIPTWEWES